MPLERVRFRTRYGRAKEAGRGGLGKPINLRGRLSSAWSWLKNGSSAARNWCKLHKGDLIVGGAIAVCVVITVLTLGGAIPIMGSAAVGAKGVALTGALGATSFGTMSCAGAVSLSLSESILVGLAWG